MLKKEVESIVDEKMKALLLGNKKISELDPAAALSGTDPLATVQGGVTVRTDPDAIKAFVENDDVSPAYGEMFFQDNATPTVITSQGSPVIVNATYVSGELEEFTHVTGKLTYEGAITRIFDVGVNLTVSLDQVNANISVLIAKDGVVIAESKQSIDCDDTTPSFKSISVSKLVSLSQFSKIEVFIQNNSGTDNITVQDGGVIVGAPGFTGAASGSDSNIFTQTEAIRSVSNTTDETQLNGTGVGPFVLPANSLSAGDRFLVNLSGQFRQNLSGAPNDQVNIKLSDGANILFETGMRRLAGNQTLRDYASYLMIHFQAVGGTTIARVHSSMSIPFVFFSDASNANILYRNSTTIDTTVDMNLILTAEFNIANVQNQITSELFSMVKI